MSRSIMPPQMQSWCRRAWLACAMGLAILLVMAFVERPHAVQAYWLAWIFWSGVSLGSLAMLLLHNLTGGAWGVSARPFAEAGARILPVLTLLFVPVLFFLGDIFPWASHHAFAGPHKQAYLTESWFAARGIIYLVILSAVTLPLGLWGKGSPFPKVAVKSPALGAAGLIIYFVVMLFASTDWITSLEPEWYSTMFVVIFAVDHFLTALALILFTVTRLHPALAVKPLHDLGNLLFAFVFFWAYVTFSQFLIIWSGNLPREIAWYLHRSTGGWPRVVILLAIVQFAVPFVLLLSRAAKSRTRILGPIAALVFCANAIHVWWLITPSFQTSGLRLPYVELAALIGMGGLWTGLFCHFLNQGQETAAHTGLEVAS